MVLWSHYFAYSSLGYVLDPPWERYTLGLSRAPPIEGKKLSTMLPRQHHCPKKKKKKRSNML